MPKPQQNQNQNRKNAKLASTLDFWEELRVKRIEQGIRLKFGFKKSFHLKVFKTELPKY